MPVEDWPTNAKIYKIWWKYCADVYVGHTRKALLSQRMTGHRSHAKCGKPAPVYAAIRNNDPFEYDLLETVFCQNFDEARTHERRWAENLGANLNGLRPICTKEERKEDMKAYRAKPENKAKQKKYDAKPEKKARHKVNMKTLSAKNLEEKRFPCEVCQYYAPKKSNLTRHQKSKRHLSRQTDM